MSIKSVVKMGNQQLAKPSLLVKDFSSKALIDLINDMKDTMSINKGVGIAAPQLGCNLRVIMFGFDHNTRYPNEKPIPFTIIINPVYKQLSQEMEEGWEGCLSVPGLRGIVSRYKQIQYSGFDLCGKPMTGSAEGFHARIIQHECDHIEGVLFPQRIKDMRNFGFEEEIANQIPGVPILRTQL